jgi:AmmeMemoRadiSam system protein B/AmmeMemoRadiSam system protein A
LTGLNTEYIIMSMKIKIAIIILLNSILLIGMSAGEDKMKSEIREPAVAGAFYPGDSTALAKTIAQLLSSTKRPEVPGEIVAIVAPHAGYMYSGPVAAYAYKAIQGYDYKDVIVISPCHVEAFEGASVYPGDAYRTPLGDIPIDKELSKKIASHSDLIRESEQGHRVTFRGGEHSLEVELPFLQTVLENFKLTAIVMGEQNMETCKQLADAIAAECKGRDDVLIVASSDLSHFHTYDQSEVLDGKIVRLIDNYDYEGLYDSLQARKVEACGGGPIVVAMMAAQKLGAKNAAVVDHANSGDVTGDRDSVVGYLAAVIYKGDKGSKVYEINMDEEDSTGDIAKNPASAVDFGLTHEDKQILLDLAYQTISDHLAGKTTKLNPDDYTGILAEKRGAFVTLTMFGNLRGCIGYIQPIKPLYETISEMADQAAFHDPRFNPIRKGEFSHIDVEISVLTPMMLVEDPKEIVVGRDGLYMVKGYYSGLLLPQVPVEQHWNRETFLDQTCIKAGLPPGSWKEPGIKIYRFQADIFGGK